MSFKDKNEKNLLLRSSGKLNHIFYTDIHYVIYAFLNLMKNKATISIFDSACEN